MTDLTRQLIGIDEGDKSKPYQDSRGIWSVALGHNLEANGLPLAVALSVYARLGMTAPNADPVPFPDCLDLIISAGGLTELEIEQLYEIDLKKNCSWLWELGWWSTANEARQAACNDMAYNLGPTKAQAFTTFYGLIGKDDWNGAADDLEFQTEVGRELPERYGRLEQLIRTGSAVGIIPGVTA